MARRKRIPYDPPHARKERKGSGPPPRPEQLFLSRRMLLARSGVVAAFGTLATRLGYLQLVQGGSLRQEDEKTTEREERFVPPRGLIYDRRGRELAVNRQTWQVRVRPSALPDAKNEPAARRRVLDELINALNLPDALILDPNAVPRAEERTVYARTAQLLGKTLTVEPTEETGELFGEDKNEETDEVKLVKIFSVPYQIVLVNGDVLLIFVYPSKKARLDESVRIALEGQLIRGISLPWLVPPKFLPSGNILTALLSTDERLAKRVARAMERFETTDTPATFAEVVEALQTDALEAWIGYIEGQRELNLLIRLEDDLTVDQAAFCRAHLHNLPGVRVMNRLEYLIENGVFQSSIVVKTGLPREVALKLEANKLYLPGVELDGGLLGRFYPGGESMSHILGFVGLVDDEILAAARVDERGRPIYEQNDWLGKDGLELKQEQALRGSVGRRRVKLNPDSGRWEIPPGSEVPAIPGKNLTLTIDLELQQAVSEILRGAIAYSNADRRANAQLSGQAPPARDSGAGAVVAIDPRNGEVLAMVSYPHFDNQLFVDGISTRKDNEYRSEEANTPLLDRAVRGQYPPGSTLKLFIAAAALHEKTLDTIRTYTCRGAITIPFDWNVADGLEKPCWAWRLGGHGPLDILGAIEQSCDVFFYNVGAPRQKPEGGADYLYYRDSDFTFGSDQVWDQHYFEGLGIEKIKSNLSNRFWFGNPTQIDLPAEEGGVVPDDGWLKKTFGREAGWSVGDTINVSIGQGFFLTTPLQLVINTAALANGGTVYRPMLVREIVNIDQQEMQAVRPEALRRLDLDQGIIDIVREGMRRVVHGELGTARKNSIDNSTKWPLTNPPNEPEIIIAGKTGTAEFGEQDAQGNYARQHAWFTCFAPLDEPEIALAVVVEDGGEGSSYAVPVADRVLRAYFELTDRRARGQVLRTAGEPPDPTGSVLAPTAAYPAPGQFAAPGPVSQD